MSESWPVVVPRENVNDDFVVVVRWLVADGVAVTAGTPIVEIETSKATVAIDAERDGFLIQEVRALEQIAVGASLGRIALTLATIEKIPIATTAATPAALPSNTNFSKKARELIEEHGLDPSMFAGKMLVREQDVRDAIAARGPQRAPAPQAPGPAAPAHSPSRKPSGIGELVPLAATKRTEIRFLAEGNRDALVSAITILVETAALDARIDAVTSRRMSYSDFLVAAVARRLREFRELNACLVEDCIGFYERVHIGVAINLGKGLKVPVVRDADTKSPEEISRAVSELAMQYLRGELPESSLVGGTFTITDLAGAGAFHVMPLLNRDQSAILAVGRDDARHVLVLTLAFDHRISEGQQATEFLRALKDDLEEAARPHEAEPQPEKTAPAIAAASLACDNCFATLERFARDGLGVFLVSTVRADGSAGHVCSVCLSGWNG